MLIVLRDFFDKSNFPLSFALTRPLHLIPVDDPSYWSEQCTARYAILFGQSLKDLLPLTRSMGWYQSLMFFDVWIDSFTRRESSRLDRVIDFVFARHSELSQIIFIMLLMHEINHEHNGNLYILKFMYIMYIMYHIYIY